MVVYWFYANKISCFKAKNKSLMRVLKNVVRINRTSIFGKSHSAVQNTIFLFVDWTTGRLCDGLFIWDANECKRESYWSRHGKGGGTLPTKLFYTCKKMFPRAEFYFIRQWFWSIPTGTRVFDFVTKKPMSNDSGERWLLTSYIILCCHASLTYKINYFCL